MPSAKPLAAAVSRARLLLAAAVPEPGDAQLVLEALVAHGLLRQAPLAGTSWPALGQTADRLQLPLPGAPLVADPLPPVCRLLDDAIGDWAAAPLDLLGQLHEQALAADSPRRKRTGAWYTPPPLVDRIAGQVLLPLLHARDTLPAGFRLLDPACGAGAFLLAARRLWHAAGLPPAALRLIGYDLDPHALRLARASLAILDRRLDGPVSLDLHPRDFLLDVPSDCDCQGIVGNPPFVFTRNRGFTPAAKRALAARYPHQGPQLGTAGLFLEAAWRRLAPGGRLGFVTPIAWLTIPSAAPLRRLLLDRAVDLTFVRLAGHPFPGASVDPMVVILQRPASPAAEPAPSVTLQTWRRSPPAVSRSLPIADIRPPDWCIPLAAPACPALLAQLEAETIPLGQLCTVATGLKAYQAGKGTPPQTAEDGKVRRYHTATPDHPACGPYLNGVDVARYRLAWSGGYLRHGPWLAEPRLSIPFSGPRLLVRQIPGRPPYLLHAAYTDQPYYHDINSMVIFNPRPGLDLLALLAILNSRAVSAWLILARDKLQRRTFPQLKVRELASVPIRLPAPPVQLQLARLAQLAHAGNLVADLEIDRLVARLYRVDPAAFDPLPG